jgi:hypothetical protein
MFTLIPAYFVKGIGLFLGSAHFAWFIVAISINPVSKYSTIIGAYSFLISLSFFGFILISPAIFSGLATFSAIFSAMLSLGGMLIFVRKKYRMQIVDIGFFGFLQGFWLISSTCLLYLLGANSASINQAIFS